MLWRSWPENPKPWPGARGALRALCLDRPAAWKAVFVGVPETHGRLVEVPAQQDLLAIQHGWEVNQSMLEVFDLDAEPAEEIDMFSDVSSDLECLARAGFARDQLVIFALEPNRVSKDRLDDAKIAIRFVDREVSCHASP